MDEYIEKILFKVAIGLAIILIGVQSLMCNDLFLMCLSIVEQFEGVRIK